jgi:propionyl-CoA carboxylase alpha chain
VQIEDQFVVVVKAADGRHRHQPVAVHVEDGSLRVMVGERRYDIASDWRFRDIRASGSCNGRPFTAQVERDGVWQKVMHNGRAIEAMMLSRRAAELMRWMPFKAPPDTSKFLLSPMPGLLADVAVQPGQTVQAGERLAVIEAMKMENILTAAQDGTVAELLAARGESLTVDQPILRFA